MGEQTDGRSDGRTGGRAGGRMDLSTEPRTNIHKEIWSKVIKERNYVCLHTYLT